MALRLRDHLGWGAAFVLLSLVATTLPDVPSDLGLDPSWYLILAHAAQTGRQFGTDIVWNYGPLGYLFTGTYAGHGLAPLVMGAVLHGCVYSIVVLVWAGRLSGVQRYLWLAMAVLPTQWWDLQPELTSLAGWLLVLEARRGAQGRSAGLAALLAVLSLFKFNHLLIAMALVALVCLDALIQRRQRLAALTLSVFLGSLAIGWVGSGQALGNVGPWLRYSMEITTGYVEAMAITGDSFTVRVAVFSFAVTLGFVALLASSSALPRWSVATAAAACLVTLFTAFKHGVVRADGHLAGGFMMLLMFGGGLATLVLAPREQFARARLAVQAGIAFVAVWGSLNARPESPPMVSGSQLASRFLLNLEAMLSPSQWAESVHMRWQALVARQGRQERKLVEKAPVDFLGFEQGTLIAAGLEFRPPPIPQAFTAYTPALIDLNQRYFDSPDAPKFVLHSVQTIDSRWPTLDGASVLRTLFAQYEPVQYNGNSIVWMKRNERAAETPSLIHTQTLRFDDEITLPRIEASDVMWAEFSWKLSLRGKLYAFLYKPPEVSIRVTELSGAERQFRLISGMASTGFMLSPFVETTEELVTTLKTGRSSKPVRSIVLTAGGADWAFLEPVEFRLRRATPLEPARSLRVLLRPLGETVSIEALLPPSVRINQGVEVAYVHAPSRVSYGTTPGRYTLKAGFGLLDGAWGGVASSDGVDFRVVIRSRTGDRVVFERRLDPALRASDRGIQMLSLPLDVGADEQILLMTSDSDVANDWTFWTQVDLAEVTGSGRAPVESSDSR